jgi:rubrerythrin
MATMADKRKVWVCKNCTQQLIAYVNLVEPPTHHCPSIKSQKIKPFHLKGEDDE